MFNKEKKKDWHNWYAWYPVLLPNGEFFVYAWLMMVDRRLVETDGIYEWEYRL